MRQRRFLFYLLVQILVIVAVVLIFKYNSDVKIAATLAGALFVLMPVILTSIETRWTGFQKKIWFFGMLQFWVLFAVPILSLRVFNWEADFETLSFWGVPGPALHYWANKSYMLMMACTMLEAWKNFRALYKNKKPV